MVCGIHRERERKKEREREREREREGERLTIKPYMTVETNAPMNPSQVFLGESLISLVRPKKKPSVSYA